MGRFNCGCVQWETRNGDMEVHLCMMHAGPLTCPIGKLDNCEHLHVESEEEFWCEHSDLDEEIEEEYCPILAERFMEE